MTHPNQLPLTHPQTLMDEITTPFKGDVLQREELAKKMTGYLSRLKAGAVIAIDAPWGEGKSWFGRNWAAQLKVDNYRVVYIDAFEQDYIEDPFLLIATEFSCLLEDDKNTLRDFNKKSEFVLRTIMPFAAKTVVNLLGAVTIGQMGLSEKIESAFEGGAEDVSDAAGDWITKRFENHEKEKLAIKAFKENLKSLASKDQEKPIVIFVDELDRCKPDFAVKLIERIKHFFNVENVIFILLVNRVQLEFSVNGVYGQGVDAHAYMDKFVNFNFKLPKTVNFSSNQSGGIYEKVNIEGAKYDGFGGELIGIITMFSTLFDLSLRQIEKVVALYVFSADQIGNPRVIFTLYAACLKVYDINLFERLVANDVKTHEYLRKMLDEAHSNRVSTRDEFSYFSVLQEWHQMVIKYLATRATDFSEISNHFRIHFRMGISSNYLPILIKEAALKIDLTVT